MKTFRDLDAFLAHLATLPAAVKHAEEQGLGHAAKLIEAEAKAEIGHYQEAAGPFPAWPELADTTKEERRELGFTENDPLLRTGELRDSISHVVQGHEAVVGTNDPRAPHLELGTNRIPPRSFLGRAGFVKGKEAAGAIAAAVAHAIAGKQWRP